MSLPEADRLRFLQALRVKGRCDAARLAGAWALDDSRALEVLALLRGEGLVEEKGGFHALSEAGERLRAQLLEAERAQVDSHAMESLYGEFLAVDPVFKQLVADVQLGTRERADAASDLAPLHEQLASLLERVSALLPRLQPYAQRFRDALAALEGGDPLRVDVDTDNRVTGFREGRRDRQANVAKPQDSDGGGRLSATRRTV